MEMIPAITGLHLDVKHSETGARELIGDLVIYYDTAPEQHFAMHIRRTRVDMRISPLGEEVPIFATADQMRIHTIPASAVTIVLELPYA